MLLDIDLKFRAVGQGAFYSGVFKTGRKKFSFVYDCGTHSSRQYLEKEVNQFVNEIDNQQIDLLIVSHFHEDHINYISDLLNKTKGAKCAILPYLSPDELYVAYIDAYTKGIEPSVETLLFIENPTNFLLERNVEKIIYIHPSDDNYNNEGNEEPTQPIIFQNDSIIQNNLFPNRNVPEINSQVQHSFDLGNLFLSPFWEFKFFSKPRNSAVLYDFLNDVKKLLSIKKITFGDVANYIKHNPSFEKEFNDIYSKNFGAKQLINETSLIVYHSPSIVFHSNIRYAQKEPRRSLNFENSGTLLTGDIIFNNKCFNDLKTKWKLHYFENVGVFQIPHHGAKNYITDYVIKNYENVKWWVINFGLGNTHKHPRQNTLDIIINSKKGGQVFANTQINQFYYGCIIRTPFRYPRSLR